MKTKKLILCSLFAAVIAISAPFSVPIGPVSVTFVLFSLALTAFTLGSRLGAVSTLVYICIGLVGLPVFSSFKGGFSVIASPTGGFVLSYVFVVLILGMCSKTSKKSLTVFLCAAALLVCYSFGTAWYMFITKSGIAGAMTVCVVPFVPFDIVKLIMAYIVAKAIKKVVNV